MISGIAVVSVAVLGLLSLAGFFVVTLLVIRMAADYMRTASKANEDMCRALIASQTPDPARMLGLVNRSTGPDLSMLFEDDEPEDPKKYHTLQGDGDLD